MHNRATSHFREGILLRVNGFQLLILFIIVMIYEFVSQKVVNCDIVRTSYGIHD